MTLNINELTIGQAKEAAQIFIKQDGQAHIGLNKYMIGKKVIIRTYSAGVHFGELIEKSGNEVILKNARRMYRFWCAKSISLSGVAIHGLNLEKSKICAAVPTIWLEAIEIIPCSEKAINDLEGAKDAEAE